MDENWTSHEVPTHLQQRDKLFLGLSLTEIIFMGLVIGISYLVWKFPLLGWVPALPRTMAIGIIAIPVMASVVIRIDDRRIPSIFFEMIRHRFGNHEYESVAFELVEVIGDEEAESMMRQGVLGSDGSLIERVQYMDADRLQMAIQEFQWTSLPGIIARFRRKRLAPFRRRRYKKILRERSARTLLRVGASQSSIPEH